eukprot:scaffold1044_cov120-Isochrysis_galbana.AAC.16
MLIAYPQSIWSDSGRNNKKIRKQHPARRSSRLSALLTHKFKRHARGNAPRGVPGTFRETSKRVSFDRESANELAVL